MCLLAIWEGGKKLSSNGTCYIYAQYLLFVKDN